MGQRERIGIYGAGGFAREVAWLIEGHAAPGFDLIGYIDDAAEPSRLVAGRPVYSWEQFRARFSEARIAVAVGDPKTREKLVTKCKRDAVSFATLVHGSVAMSSSVSVGAGSIICCGSILTVNITLHEHVHINLDCTIGHDVRIGAFTTLAPGVHISGNVHVGRSVYIGTGATIINGSPDEPLVIGDGSVIGAAACLTGSAEANCLYVGVPATLKKRYGASTASAADAHGATTRP